jgi:hypothetical protein
MIAWATASVTTSASVTLHRASLAFTGRRSSAVQNTAVREQVEVGGAMGPWVDGVI